MRRRLALIAAAALVFLAPHATANTTKGTIAFVSATGSDSNDGLTLSTPKLTVKTAVAAATTNGTVYLLDTGGPFTLSNQGSSALENISPGADSVSVVGYPGHAPVFDLTGKDYNGSVDFIQLGGTDDATLLKNFTIENWSASSGIRVTIRILAGCQNVVIDGLHFIDCGGSASPSLLYQNMNAAANIVIKNSTWLVTSEQDWDFQVELDGDAVPDFEIVTLQNLTFNNLASLDIAPYGLPTAISVTQIDSLIAQNVTIYNAGWCDASCQAAGSSGNPTNAITLLDVDRAWLSDIHVEARRNGLTPESPMHNRQAIETATFSSVACDTVNATRVDIRAYGHGFEALGTDNISLSYVYCDSTIDDCVFLNSAAATNGATISNCVSHAAGDNGFDIKSASTTLNHVTVAYSDSAGVLLSDTSDNCSVTNSIFYNCGRGVGANGGLLGAIGSSGSGQPTSVTIDYNLWWSDYDHAKQFFYADPTVRYYSFVDWQTIAGFDTHGVFADPLLLDPGNADAWGRGGLRLAPSAAGPAAAVGNDGLALGALQAWKPTNSDVNPNAEVVRAVLGGRRAKAHTLFFTTTTDVTPQTIHEGWQIGSLYMQVNQPDSVSVTVKWREQGQILSAVTDSMIVGAVPVFLPVDTDSVSFAVTSRDLTDYTGLTTVSMSLVTYPK